MAWPRSPKALITNPFIDRRVAPGFVEDAGAALARFEREDTDTFEFQISLSISCVGEQVSGDCLRVSIDRPPEAVGGHWAKGEHCPVFSFSPGKEMRIDVRHGRTRAVPRRDLPIYPLTEGEPHPGRAGPRSAKIALPHSEH